MLTVGLRAGPGRITARRAKATLLALLDDVAAGDEVEITKHGRTVARLIPAKGANALRGRLARTARTAVPDEGVFSTGEAWDAQ
ncbi:MAG: type II toxin-antitoxin system Phd/YefM family antitoxin [Acidimicrobiales bacterium]